MAKWRCKVCGEIITDEAMTQCPVCKAGKDKWEEVVEGAGRVWATEHKVGEGLACGDEEIIAGFQLIRIQIQLFDQSRFRIEITGGTRLINKRKRFSAQTLHPCDIVAITSHNKGGYIFSAHRCGY